MPQRKVVSLCLRVRLLLRKMVKPLPARLRPFRTRVRSRIVSAAVASGAENMNLDGDSRLLNREVEIEHPLGKDIVPGNRRLCKETYLKQ